MADLYRIAVREQRTERALEREFRVHPPSGRLSHRLELDRYFTGGGGGFSCSFEMHDERSKKKNANAASSALSVVEHPDVGYPGPTVFMPSWSTCPSMCTPRPRNSGEALLVELRNFAGRYQASWNLPRK
jgi:hypothetical protein